MALTQSDLNAIDSIVRDRLVDFDRLPVIWANQTRPTHWYVVGMAPFKRLVTSPEASSLVANGLAEWAGSRAGVPQGIGQAAIVPDNILALYQTVGSDNYPSGVAAPAASTITMAEILAKAAERKT